MYKVKDSISTFRTLIIDFYFLIRCSTSTQCWRMGIANMYLSIAGSPNNLTNKDAMQ